MGLSGRMNNEARFQHIKGEGGDGGARLHCSASPWRIHRASVGTGRRSQVWWVGVAGGWEGGGFPDFRRPKTATRHPIPAATPAKRAAR